MQTESERAREIDKRRTGLEGKLAARSESNKRGAAARELATECATQNKFIALETEFLDSDSP